MSDDFTSLNGDTSGSRRSRHARGRRKHSRTREEALDKLKRILHEEYRLRVRAAGANESHGQ